MPGARNRQEKLYQEWGKYAGLPEDALPRPEPEEQMERGRGQFPWRRPDGGKTARPALASLKLGELPDSLLIILLLGLAVVLSIVNLVMLAVVLFIVSNL